MRPRDVDAPRGLIQDLHSWVTVSSMRPVSLCRPRTREQAISGLVPGAPLQISRHGGVATRGEVKRHAAAGPDAMTRSRPYPAGCDKSCGILPISAAVFASGAHPDLLSRRHADQ